MGEKLRPSNPRRVAPLSGKNFFLGRGSASLGARCYIFFDQWFQGLKKCAYVAGVPVAYGGQRPKY